jgi:hypothetical protein
VAISTVILVREMQIHMLVFEGAIGKVNSTQSYLKMNNFYLLLQKKSTVRKVMRKRKQAMNNMEEVHMVGTIFSHEI